MNISQIIEICSKHTLFDCIFDPHGFPIHLANQSSNHAALFLSFRQRRPHSLDCSRRSKLITIYSTYKSNYRLYNIIIVPKKCANDGNLNGKNVCLKILHPQPPWINIISHLENVELEANHPLPDTHTTGWLIRIPLMNCENNPQILNNRGQHWII